MSQANIRHRPGYGRTTHRCSEVVEDRAGDPVYGTATDCDENAVIQRLSIGVGGDDVLGFLCVHTRNGGPSRRLQPSEEYNESNMHGPTGVFACCGSWKQSRSS